MNWKHQTQSVVNRCDKTRNLQALRSLKQDNKRATSMAAISNMGHQPISFLALWEHLQRKDLQNHHGAVKSWIAMFSFISSLPFFNSIFYSDILAFSLRRKLTQDSNLIEHNVNIKIKYEILLNNKAEIVVNSDKVRKENTKD